MSEQTQATNTDQVLDFDPDEVMELVDLVSQGVTLKTIRGFTDEQMEAIYTLAYNCYESGKYGQVHNMFKFLSFYDPYEKRYWMSMGGCRQMMQMFQSAVEAYSMASLNDVEDPTPPLHAADCLLA